MKKYVWNKKKFAKNMLKLATYVVGIIGIGFMFAYVGLGLCGIDIVL